MTPAPAPSERDREVAREVCDHEHCETYHYCWTCRTVDGQGCARLAIMRASARAEGAEAVMRHVTGAVMLSESPIGPLHKIGWNAAVQHIVAKINSGAPGVDAVEAAFSRGVEAGAQAERRACWLILQRRYMQEQVRINEMVAFIGSSTGPVMDACRERDLIGKLRDEIDARGPLAPASAPPKGEP